MPEPNSSQFPRPMPATPVQEGLHSHTAVAVAARTRCIEIAGGRSLGPAEHRSLAGLGNRLMKAVHHIDHLAGSGVRPLAAVEHRNRSHRLAGLGMRACYAVEAGTGPVGRAMGTDRIRNAAVVEAGMKVSAVRTVYGKLRCRKGRLVGLNKREVDVDHAVDRSSRRRLDPGVHTTNLENAHTARSHVGSGQYYLGCSLQQDLDDRTIAGLVVDKLLVELHLSNRCCAGQSMSSRNYSNSVGFSWCTAKI